ncbi:hypothetical protein ACFVZC_16275 [Streptomyces marokkonensis]|uniref:Uncharacterized protein n=1 Tax=Streptomyces marokkonensis TaxID=324855 RepID=A0ABW6Q6X5_9ACTN|nr:hypothetical protein [Streptomyces marokkonensis]
MRRITSVLITSAALVAALASPAIADDDHRVLGLIPVKADNAYLLNNTHALENANIELLTQR